MKPDTAALLSVLLTADKRDSKRWDSLAKKLENMSETIARDRESMLQKMSDILAAVLANHIHIPKTFTVSVSRIGVFVANFLCLFSGSRPSTLLALPPSARQRLPFAARDYNCECSCRRCIHSLTMM
jgi:hypothetical protein